MLFPTKQSPVMRRLLTCTATNAVRRKCRLRTSVALSLSKGAPRSDVIHITRFREVLILNNGGLEQVQEENNESDSAAQVK